MSLFDAAVDLNPHQIEAALFALQSPLSKGVILADEVGLGKTIEAGIVLCQFWAERKRRLLVICPASLRKQWAWSWRRSSTCPRASSMPRPIARRNSGRSRAPFARRRCSSCLSTMRTALREELKAIAWDLVVIDEAHKLRNAYRPKQQGGPGHPLGHRGLPEAPPDGDAAPEFTAGAVRPVNAHRRASVRRHQCVPSQYTSAGGNLAELRQRLSDVLQTTLRNQVTEYIRYTERRAITRPFRPTDDEHALYEAVSAFLQRPDSYALPQRQRHLTALILRKLLASSSQAIAATLDTLRARLEALRDEQARSDPELAEAADRGRGDRGRAARRDPCRGRGR